MNLPTTYGEVDYSAIDPIISSWAKQHEIVIDREYKGYAVRSFWLDGKIQLWINAPDTEGYIRVHLAELKSSLASKWGRSVEWRTSESELSDCLEEVWSIGHKWL
jgi:hypothetical protein